MNQEAITAALLGLPVIVGVIQALKIALYIPNRILPLLALAFGVAFTVGGAVWSPGPIDVDAGYFEQVIAGIVLGLAASGLYDVTAMNLDDRKNDSPTPPPTR
jgi:hypothetical protein